MKTITEDYVSFEVAKLLKEKGFDSDEVGSLGGFYSESCYESGHGITTQSGQEVGIVYDDLTNAELEHDEYLRPTLQMAMKWLREEKGIAIIPTISSILDEEKFLWDVEIVTTKNKTYRQGWVYEHQEEIIDYAIRWSLENLITNNNEKANINTD